MKQYADKVAIVTGGASGMGRAVAKQFAELGASVVVADLSAANGGRVVEEINTRGGRAAFWQTDVSMESNVDALVDFTLETYGRLDWSANMAGLVQAGGIYCPKTARDSSIAVNLMGTIYCVAAEARAMKRSGGGAIVNCSSVGGVQGSADSPYYVAAKHGILGFTKSAALELAPFKIRVNAICPGLTRSAMTEKYYGEKLESVAQFVPIGRLGEPEDQANGVIWLCMPESSFVTGAAFHLDGGQTAGLSAGLMSTDASTVNQ